MTTTEIILLIILLIQSILLIISLTLFLKRKDDKENDNYKEEINNLNDQIRSLKSQIDSLNNLLYQSSHLTNESIIKYNQNTTSKLDETLNKFYKDTYSFLDNKLDQIDRKLNEKLDSNFKENKDTLSKMIESMQIVKDAQLQLEDTQKEIVSLQNLLSDKKTRGCFGEVQLNSILYNVFGENGKNSVYQIQYRLPLENQDLIADAILNCPNPLGLICIDSKFPLENYRRMINEDKKSPLYKKYCSDFSKDVKTHINDIASKYIKEGITANQAIMFLPSEAIFAEINANFYDLVEYAQQRNVWITSPTTLMAFLTTVATMLENIKFSKNLNVVKSNLMALSRLFDNYKTRWDSLVKHIEGVSKDVKDITITTNKITSSFTSISENKDFLDD